VSEVETQDVIETQIKSIPQVGEIVVFHPRPGEFRGGRSEFPALVMGENRRTPGAIDLLVFYDREDTHLVEGAEECPADRSSMGWTRSSTGTLAGSPERDALISLSSQLVMAQSRIEALEEQVQMVSRALFGGLEMPDGESVLGILDEHEDRISAVEKLAKPKPNTKAARAAAAAKTE
jgi:hypothetical protein